MGKLRGWCVRGERNRSIGHRRLAERRRQDGQKPVGIVQRTGVVVKNLEAAYDSSRMMRAQCMGSGMRQSKREPAASFVHPESETGLPSLGDDVRIAVPIDIRNDNPQDEIVCAET
jgi:hypothetical protein